MVQFNDFLQCMATFWSIKLGSTKYFDYTFIIDTQVDIKKNLPRYLRQVILTKKLLTFGHCPKVPLPPPPPVLDMCGVTFV